MFKIRLSALALAGGFLISCHPSGAATFSEDFSGDPAARGWQFFGNPNLFHWDATNSNLTVTWDSSRPNSYFHRQLGTILAKDDDFSLAFNLRLSDIAIGVNTNKPYGFQIAIGFINYAEATDTNFLRGTGFSSPNLVEFDYFPDSGFGATISPTIISSNNQFAYSFNIFELTTNDLFHIAMSYTASNHTLATMLTRNAAPFGPINDAVLATNFTDFRVDHVAVCSYSDAGQDPQFSGSILAHGVVDNFVVTTPPPPVTNLTGEFTNNIWQVQFISRTNWLYTLERTADLQPWSPVSPTVNGNATNLLLQDTNPPTDKAFYRVRAERP